jgi:Zn ribbon nucleic-acid-binding protein
MADNPSWFPGNCCACLENKQVTLADESMDIVLCFHCLHQSNQSPAELAQKQCYRTEEYRRIQYEEEYGTAEEIAEYYKREEGKCLIGCDFQCVWKDESTS